MIRNMDDMTQIITRTVTCNITGNTTTIKNMGNMTEKLGMK